VVLKEWNSGPFTPVLRDAHGKDLPMPAAGARIDPEWRLYARSASDDKAPVMTITSALDALDAAKVGLTSNIKIFLEGEEEAGSRNLERLVTVHRDLLGADLWIFCDGPVHQSRRQQVVFGARGNVGIEITVYGPRRELHSGHYGNWAPNPAMMLSRLLASMKDDDGRVTIEGFYDDVEPLNETERAALAKMPAADDELKRELWLGATDGKGRRLDELVNQPSLNIRGLASASTGDLSRNVIPERAVASIDLRLVPGNEPRRQVDRVIAHMRKQGYFVVTNEPDERTRAGHAKVARVRAAEGYRGVRTPMDLPLVKQVLAAVDAARGEAIRTPLLGGSLPLYVFTDVLKTPLVIVPIANHDNNQHAANENIRLQNLWDGIETMAAIMAMQVTMDKDGYIAPF
jgi:acetylornithine deacetylase/succinyl-diaminopimelate desuccinylase-like protein